MATTSLTPKLDGVFKGAPADIQERLLRVFALIEVDPQPDNVTKFWVDRPPAVLTVIYAEGFVVLYHIPNVGGDAVHIYGWSEGELPSP